MKIVKFASISIILFFLLCAPVFADVWLITPGVGIDWIKLGMSFSRVEKALGSHYTTKSSSADEITHSYESDYGLEFCTNNKGYITQIWISKVGYKRTIYQTKEGIRVGWLLSDVTRVLGKPGASWNWLEYPGILISGSDTQDKVETICVKKGMW
jgi:hypothetical protein